MLSRMTAEFTSVSHGPSARVPKNAALATCRLAKAQSDTPTGEKKIEFCYRGRAGGDLWPPRPLRCNTWIDRPSTRRGCCRPARERRPHPPKGHQVIKCQPAHHRPNHWPNHCPARGRRFTARRRTCSDPLLPVLSCSIVPLARFEHWRWLVALLKAIGMAVHQAPFVLEAEDVRHAV